MKNVVKKYQLGSDRQQQETLTYWKNKSIEHKLEVLESLRADAIKLGLYPELDAKEPRLQRVYKITSQT